MRNSILVCAFLALSVFAAEARFAHNREVLGSSAESSSKAKTEGDGTAVHVSANAKSTKGKASAKAEGYAEVDERAVNAVAYAISSAYSIVKDGGDVKATVDAKAEAVGEAFALAYTKAYASVFSDNEGNTACARVFASGKAAATAFAKAYAEGVARAKNKYGEIVADGSAEAFAVATAKAYAAAESEVCINGKGRAEAFQESLAISLVKPIATAMYKAFVAVDSYGTTTGYAAAEADSTKEDEVTYAESKGHAGVETFGDSHGYGFSGGSAGADSEQVEACTGYFAYKCCYSYGYGFGKSSDKCSCGKGCEAELEEVKLDYHVMKLWTVTKTNGHAYEHEYQCYCH